MKKDIMIGMPSYDHRIDISVSDTIQRCIQDPESPVFNIAYHSGDSLVTRARNSIAATFLDYDEVEYLLFIDSDIHFEPEHILSLRKHNKGVIAGMCMKKTLPYRVVANYKLGQEGTLGIMREVGTGFLMIRKDVFRKIAEMRPDLHYNPYEHEYQSKNYYNFFGTEVDQEKKVYLSEDYAFCKMAREAGYTIYLDETVMTKHRGEMMFPTDDLNILLTAEFIIRSWNSERVEEPHLTILKSIRTAINQRVGSDSVLSGYLANSSAK